MLKITATGLNEWDATFIRTAVVLANGLDVGAWEYVDRREEADFVLVNASDSREAAALQSSLSASDPQHPKLVPYSDDPAVADGQNPSLRRPVTYPALVRLLLGLQGERGAKEAEAPKSGDASTSPAEMALAGTDAELEPKAPNAEDSSGASLKPEPLNPSLIDTDDLARQQEAYSTKSVPDENLHQAPTSSAEEVSMVPQPNARWPLYGAISLEDDAACKTAPDVDSGAAAAISEWLGEAATPENNSEAPGDSEPPRLEGARPIQEPPPAESPNDTDGFLQASALGRSPDAMEKREAPDATRTPAESPNPASRAEIDAAVPAGYAGESTANFPLTTTATEFPPDKQKRAELLTRDPINLELPENARFLAILRDTIARGQATEITHERFPRVGIYPVKRVYTVPQDEPLDAEMFRALASEFDVHALPTEQPEKAAPTGHTEPLWKLLYLAALYGSAGCLKESASYGDRLHLVAAPDFRLVPDIPDHQSIARYMLAETTDIVTIAAETGTSVPTVIDFTNACDEVLLIDREPSATDPPSAGTGGQRPSLWHRIRSLWRQSY